MAPGVVRAALSIRDRTTMRSLSEDVGYVFRVDREAHRLADLLAAGVLRLLIARAKAMPQLAPLSRHTRVSIALMRERDQSVHVVRG